jgi:hypothetical protein
MRYWGTTIRYEFGRMQSWCIKANISDSQDVEIHGNWLLGHQISQPRFGLHTPWIKGYSVVELVGTIVTWFHMSEYHLCLLWSHKNNLNTNLHYDTRPIIISNTFLYISLPFNKTVLAVYFECITWNEFHVTDDFIALRAIMLMTYIKEMSSSNL